MQYEFICVQEDCPEEEFTVELKLTEYEEKHNLVCCHRCGYKAQRVLSTYGKHSSWTTWRMGHGS